MPSVNSSSTDDSSPVSTGKGKLLSALAESRNLSPTKAGQDAAGGKPTLNGWQTLFQKHAGFKQQRRGGGKGNLFTKFAKSRGAFTDVVMEERAKIRRETATALTDVVLLSLPFKQYEQIMNSYVDSSAKESLRFMRELDLFKNWGHQRLKMLCQSLEVQNYPKKALLKPSNTRPDAIYFVVKGRVGLYKDLLMVSHRRWPTSATTWQQRTTRSSKRYHICELKEYDYIGLESLMEASQSDFVARCTTPCQILVLPRDLFFNLLGDNILPMVREKIKQRRLLSIDKIVYAIKESIQSAFMHQHSVRMPTPSLPAHILLSNVLQGEEDGNRRSSLSSSISTPSIPSANSRKLSKLKRNG